MTTNIRYDPPTFDCDNNTCSYTCNLTEQCMTYYDDNSNLHRFNISCPMHHKCSVNCLDTRACFGAHVICPRSQQCDIFCNNTIHDACGFITYNSPDDISLFNISWIGMPPQGLIYPLSKQIDDYTNYSLQCHGDEQCRMTQIDCPKYAYCHISCIGELSCMAVKFLFISIAPVF